MFAPELLAEATDDELEQLLDELRHDEYFVGRARPEQHPPDGDWSTWLIQSGRGWGKTRTGAEWLAEHALSTAASRWAIVAATFPDGRDTCVEGESGLLAVLRRRRPDVDWDSRWNRSLGEIELPNRSRVKLFTAEKPARLRGPQHHGAWCDEAAAWMNAVETWDQLAFGLRLGDRPRVVVTTTPQPTRLIRRLVDEETTTVTRGSTFDNAANLPASRLDELRRQYEGTRIGRQELYGELLTDTPGALWTVGGVDAHRVTAAPALQRVVVAIDPAVTSGEDSDATGIIAAALGVDGEYYVLADRTCRDSPDAWARVAVDLYDELAGDRIVAEVNNGGDLVATVLRAVDPSVPVRTVHASRGKRMRAEPVAALYEQGRVHHVGGLPELEDQMTTWTPASADSPDRLDALVWAITDLAGLSPGQKRRRGIVASGSL